MKRVLKTSAIYLAKRLGPLLPGRFARRWLFHTVAPRLLDPTILPNQLVDRPLRRVRVDVPCNPYTYVHGNYFWCGVFFEEEVEDYMRRELRPGDTVIDVGANVGHVALPAAALVKPTGQVLAFEPNPELAEIVAASAARQGLPLRMHSYGLGDQPGSFTLRMEPGHAGGATLRDKPDSSMTRALQCRIEVGDLTVGKLTGRVLLKVDVEGFELSVLRGLARTMEKIDHAVIEVSPEWLGPEGVESLFSLMKQGGLGAHALLSGGRVGKSLIPKNVISQQNVVFVRSEPKQFV